MPLVLLVEDEETLRKVLRSLLERDGFEVAEAADGAEALTAVDRLSPDAVVLDLNLPVLDGYDVLSRLRTRTTSATLPVLVLTANGDEASETRALKMGANEFLTKPFRPRALGARLKLLLSRDGE
ncbi:MAG TPA: response regulator transcription factor [Gemmatimonadaceae bacterium]|nr:response regulator transcription factor [Gemmatimonadaceae bacterium]